MSSAIAPPQLKLIHFFGAGAPGESASESVLGGKGHSLAAMSKGGLPVPPGFTISTDCCRVFHEQKCWPGGLQDELDQALAWLEEVTDSKFGAPPRPLLVAVRSGAAVSMPGMMDTVLNVGLNRALEDSWRGGAESFWNTYADFIKHYGETVSGFSFELPPPEKSRERAAQLLELYRSKSGNDFPDDPKSMLAQAVNAVFESWNSQRAIKYRVRNNVRHLSGTAVNVQAMFPCEHSGVLFTLDPNHPDSQRIIIETSTGLGEALVLGHVEPDVFIVDRQKISIVEKRLASPENNGSLSDQQIAELAKLGLSIEEYFKYPVDIEWGWAGGRFALMQSRRIRGLDIARDVPAARHDEIERLRKLAGAEKKVWTIHNLGETLNAPTPLTWDIVGEFMRRGFLQLYQELGFVPSQRVRNEGFLELIAGRIYVDAAKAAELFFDQFPLEYDLENPSSEQLLGPPSNFNYERAGLGFLIRLPWYLSKMYRSSRILRRSAARCLQEFQSEKVPAFLDYAARARARPLAKMSDTELFAELNERERVALNDFGRETLKPGFLANDFHGRLMKNLDLIFGREKAAELSASLLRGLDGDKTVESNIALFRVAKGELSLDQFIQDFGHRAVNEFEFSERRWSEDRSYLQQIVENHKRPGAVSPADLHERQKQERLAAECALPKLLADHGASSLEDEIRADLTGAQTYLPFRETGKHYFMMAVALIREVLEEFAERFDLGKDLYFLQRSDLAVFPSRRDEFKNLIAARKLRWQSLQRVNVPEVLSSDNLEALGKVDEAAASNDGVFSGVGVAAGTGSGKACVIKSPHEAGNLGNDYVLVCPTTDPSWAPLFVNARGLIVERGGVLSHGAIVARDFGIPAVVLKDALRLIPNGASVKVDGSRGRVELVKS